MIIKFNVPLFNFCFILLVYEYCSYQPFNSVPKFTSQPESSRKFYNSTTQKNENWFSLDSKLSVSFAICKVSAYAVALSAHDFAGLDYGADLVVMTALCKVRTSDFINLKLQLEDQIMLDNHHQASQI